MLKVFMTVCIFFTQNLVIYNNECFHYFTNSQNVKTIDNTYNPSLGFPPVPSHNV